MLRKVIELLFFGRIFIAFCAVAMCIQTNVLLHTSLNHPLFYCFVFGATLVQYNLPYVINFNKQLAQKRLLSFTSVSYHHWFAVIGFLIMLFSVFVLTIWQIVLLLVVGIITIMYSFGLMPFKHGKRLKDFGSIKIFTLTIMWVIVTVILPVIGKTVSTAWLLILCVVRLNYLWVLCLLFDLRDITLDNNAGIKTIPVLLGINKTRLLCYSLTVMFLLLALFFASQTQNISILNGYIITVAATFFIIRLTKSYTSAIFYLACVDGLLLLQAMLIIIGSI